MGLLDNFNFDDPTSMGLLSAGMNILGNSGRGNNAQVIGQGLGAGMQGAGDVIRARKQAAQDALNAQMEKMKLDTGNMNLQQLQDNVTRNKSIRDALMKDRMDNQQPSPMNQQNMQDQLPTSSGYQSDMGSQMPAWAMPKQAAPMSQAQSIAPQGMQQAQPVDDRYRQIDELNRTAKIFAENGDYENANAFRDKAIKLQPKFDTKTQVGLDKVTGQPFSYITDEQGNTKRLNDTLPRDELHFGDNNGQLIGQDKYTGKIISTNNKVQSPDSLASNARILSEGNLNRANSLLTSGIDNKGATLVDENGDPLNDKKGGKLSLSGGRESVYLGRIVNGATLATKAISNIMDLPITSSTGMFGGIKQGDSLLQAGKTVLSNQVTGQEAQSYKVMMAGVSRNLAAIEASGLAPSGSLTSQLHDAVELREGDTQLTKMRKIAEVRQIIEHGMEPILSNPRLAPEQTKQIQGVVDRLKVAVPFTHEDITRLEKSKNPGESILSSAQKSGLGGSENNTSSPGVMNVPPLAAINMLKMNPKLRADFDAKYGQGAADSALGK